MNNERWRWHIVLSPGEYVLKEDINVTSLSVDEPPSALLQQPNFSLEQAFQLVCLDESCTEVNLVIATIYILTKIKI